MASDVPAPVPAVPTAVAAPVPVPTRGAASVLVTDVPATRTHHPGDLVAAVLTALGIGAVMLLAVYAQHTTTGVQEDVQGFADLLRRILFVPVNALVVAGYLIAPLAVLVALAVRRRGRAMLLALTGGVGGLALAALIDLLIADLHLTALRDGLSVFVDGERVLLPVGVALAAGTLTPAGPRERERLVRWSWNLLWVVIGVLLITGQVSLPGVAVALLVGRAVGLVVRHLGGIEPRQAYGRRLVAGVQRAGFDAAALVRVPDPATAAADPPLPESDPGRAALVRATGTRVYGLRTVGGDDLDLVVLDGDRQVVGMLQRLWRSIRLRGLDGRRVVSLRAAAERSALLGYAAQAAGVRTPRLLSMSEVDDSMLRVAEHPAATPLTDLPDERITDAVLVDLWAQLRRAHQAGVAHRALTSDVVLVGDDDRVWITAWDNGDVASSELARRIDLTQVLAMLALRVGATRALDSAGAVLADDDVARIGPLLQTITLPQRTREELRRDSKALDDLRTALVARLPQADVEPVQLVRFGARTLVTVLITAVALVVILAGVNVEQIKGALEASDWRWSAVGYALGLATLVGAALALVAFAPIRLPLWRTTLVQTAATWVALAAPAGIGPAALNLRMLTRRGVATPIAAATVALVQVSQFAATLLVLLVLGLLPGGGSSTISVSPTMLVVAAAVVALIGAALLVPRVRSFAATRLGPSVRQTWPRLIEVLGQPWRLALGMGGNLVMTLGYVFAFQASLTAFGVHADLVQIAVVYLAGNTAGALIPTPGGLGTVEIALTGGLTGIGINPGVAVSVAVLFRVLTYWLRIPLGFVAYRVLQRSGEL